MRSQHNRKLTSLALAVVCGLGFSGCQRANFPSNPFAGKLPSLPMPRLLGGKAQAPNAQPLASKLAVPKLPGLSKLPRPNFGNLARTVRTPAADAIAARTNQQPPSAPSRTFDTSSADRQIAAGTMPADVKSSLDRARKAAEASRDAIDTSQNDFNSAIANTKPPKSGDLFSKIKTKSEPAANQQAGSSSRTDNLWGDYKPDTRPGSANRSSGGIADLAKVNPRLYDRYGKLTTSDGKPTGDFVATNVKKDFDFQPANDAATGRKPNFSTGGTDVVSSDDSEATIAGLRSQLMELRARGAGNSDQYKMPNRSAFEIAGVAPKKPVVEKPEQPLHRGFGNAATFGERQQQTVAIADPTAPANVLRAAAPKTPGMVATKEIKSRFNQTASNTPATELPVGNALSNKFKSSNGSGNKNENMVGNDFVGSPDTQAEAPPTLRASAFEQVRELELPRQLSQASKDALEQTRLDKLNQPLPEINGNSGPLIGGFENPKVASVQVQQQPEPQVRQASSAFPGHFQTQTPGRQQQVTSNQFFNRAAKPAAVAEPVAAPEARVAEVPESVSSLPDGITTGNSSYAPGSVRSLEKKLW